MGKSRAADPYNEGAIVFSGGRLCAGESCFYCYRSSYFIWGSLQNLAESERIARLEVFDAQPSPAGLLSLDQAITFTFNRRADCAAAESAFAWQPAIRGRLTCDEYSLEFEPLDQYQRDASYTFAFTPPLQAKDGAPLLDPFRAHQLDEA